MKVKAATSLKRFAKGLCLLLGVFLLCDLVSPVRTYISFSQMVAARDGSVLHAYLSADAQWRFNTRLEEITPELKKAIIFKEDKYFYYHAGINPVAIARALVNNIFRQRRTSGASTITMQVARMLQPKQRTYGNKCVEMFRALQLELHYTKNEILQLYLNLVPYGSNIQGVKAASMLYFNKTPDHLSLAEITALSVIPNRPNSLVIGKDNAAVVMQRNKWLRRFGEAALFRQNTINDALAEPLNAYRRNAPSAAPQFSYRMLSANPGTREIITTINNTIQAQAETIAANYMKQLKLHNINNAAILIVDNKSHQVVTYVGSSDFYDSLHFGQVDGVQALRSPGSTLKPFLYGLCFDKGLITPKSMIADVSININGYTPENYDRIFRGNVTIEDALSHSLNIPAVKLLEAEGLDNFINALGRVGFRSVIDSRKDIGLSLILGGCSVRLEELTTLYTAFANEGRYAPLQYLLSATTTANPQNHKPSRLQAPPPTANAQTLSPEANYLLGGILSQLHRPDFPNNYVEAQGIPRISWKTGTSYGRKDAWSIGYNKQYTVGVWVGNFNADGVQELSGTGTATPLLFRIFTAIDPHSGNDVAEPPAGIGFRHVCAVSGKIPEDFCDKQIMDLYIPGVSACDRCTHLQKVWTSADGKVSYCTSCLPAAGYKSDLLPNLSPELIAYYEGARIPYVQPPPHNPACTRTFQGVAPVITSLTNGMTYLIENKEQQQFQLSCSAGNDVKKVYWYINDKFYAAADANSKLFFSASATTLKISCSDDKGRNTNIEIKVKFI